MTTIEPLCWVPNPFVPSHDTQCIHCGKLDEELKVHKNGHSSSFIDCPFQCGAKFCGESCRNTAYAHHSRICVGPHSDNHALYRIKLLALEAGPVGYGMIMLATSVVLENDDSTSLLDSFPSLITLKQEEEKENVEVTNLEAESYEIIVEILGRDDAPSLQNWVFLLRYVNRHCLTVILRSRYAIESEKIAESTDQEWQNYLLDLAGTESLVELMDEADHFFPSSENFCLLLQGDGCALRQH
eukprot:10535290-Ditylum_brightwellii.AAC.1